MTAPRLVSALDGWRISASAAFRPGDARPTELASGDDGSADAGLTELLYTELQTRARWGPRATDVADGAWTALMRHARPVGSRDPGWSVERSDEGELTVVAPWSDAAFRAPSGEVHGEHLPGATVTVTVPTLWRSLLHGFVTLSGAHGVGTATLVRVYLHLRPEGYGTFVDTLVPALDAAGIPFRLKLFAPDHPMDRADAVVLYMPPEALPETTEPLATAIRRTAGHLAPECPVFALPVVAGVAVASLPGTRESLGMARARELAKALLRQADTTPRWAIALLRRAPPPWLAHPYAEPPIVEPLQRWASALRARVEADDAASLSPRRPTATPQPSLEDAVERLTATLVRTATWSGDACSWLARLDGRGSGAGALGLDRYGGLPGVAELLAEVARHTGDPAARRAALGATAAMALHRPLDRAGLLDGAVGAMLSACRVARLLDDDRPLRSVSSVSPAALALLEDPAPRPDHLDLVSGLAGGVLGLLRFAEEAPAAGLVPPSVDAIHRLARALAQAQSQAPSSRLLGLAHGLAGEALALHRAARATGDPELACAADAAEAALLLAYAPGLGWPDRRSGTGARFGESWCHGSAGILELLTARSQTGPERAFCVAGALRAVTDIGPWLGSCEGLCPCHGLAGSLWALRDQGVAPPPGTLAAFARAAVRLTERPAGTSPLGLLDGLAGVAWVALRLLPTSPPGPARAIWD